MSAKDTVRSAPLLNLFSARVLIYMMVHTGAPTRHTFDVQDMVIIGGAHFLILILGIVRLSALCSYKHEKLRSVDVYSTRMAVYTLTRDETRHSHVLIV